MRRRATLALLLVALGCSGAARTKTETKPLTPAQIAALATPSIVLIRASDGSEGMVGTGFVVWKDGRIATNLHVIAGASSAVVVLADGREFKDIQVLAVDAQHDLAVLRIGAKDLPVLTLGDSSTMHPGDRVVAIGHPLGLGNTVSDGLVSAVRKLNANTTLLQVSVPISQGSSGGPIFDERGAVVGVSALVSKEGQNLNFAVPAEYLKPMLLAEQPISLSELANLIKLAILQGCTGDEIKLAFTALREAIKIGVPKYNGGDHEGCFQVYRSTAESVAGQLTTCQGIRDTLLEGIELAKHVDTAGGRAWAVRRAFDRVLEAIAIALQEAEGR